MGCDIQRFAVELRAEVTEEGRLRGHAAVFGQAADLGRGGLEQIERRAFDRALADESTDVRALINHDPNQLLGRQSAGTLRLDTDDRGLLFDVDLPDTTYAHNLRALMRRGDLTGASFGFIPGKDSWSQRGGRQLRTHTEVGRLVDVSVVTFPAYDGAGAQLRSMPASHSNRSRLVIARHRVLIKEKP